MFLLWSFFFRLDNGAKLLPVTAWTICRFGHKAKGPIFSPIAPFGSQPAFCNPQHHGVDTLRAALDSGCEASLLTRSGVESLAEDCRLLDDRASLCSPQSLLRSGQAAHRHTELRYRFCKNSGSAGQAGPEATLAHDRRCGSRLDNSNCCAAAVLCSCCAQASKSSADPCTLSRYHHLSICNELCSHKC